MLIEEEIERLKATQLKPTMEVQGLIAEVGGSELKDGIRAADLLRRPETGSVRAHFHALCQRSPPL